MFGWFKTTTEPVREEKPQKKTLPVYYNGNILGYLEDFPAPFVTVCVNLDERHDYTNRLTDDYNAIQVSTFRVYKNKMYTAGYYGQKCDERDVWVVEEADWYLAEKHFRRELEKERDRRF